MGLDPRATTTKLHDLSTQLYTLVENLKDLEEQLNFHLQTSQKVKDAITSQTEPVGLADEIYMLEYLLSACRDAEQWILNYRDRANIRINLVRI